MRRVEYLRHQISRKRTAGQRLLLVVAGIALATLVRLLLDQGRLGVPFLTFAPVVLVIAILLGWRHATLTASISVLLILAFSSIEPAVLGPRPVVLVGAIFILAAALIYIGDIMHVAILAIDEQRQQFLEFNTELQHRSGNALQIIQAFISQARGSMDLEKYQALSGRLEAMATANRLLGPGQHQVRELHELIIQTLASFPKERFRFSGPPCHITGKAGVRLVMALHELATNAVKYGALSSPLGAVSISWQICGDDIDLNWRELGGPPVHPPSRQGLGSRILVPSEGIREVNLTFHPAGVECRIRAEAHRSAG